MRLEQVLFAIQKNGTDFTNEISANLNIQTRVLTGNEEAKLIYRSTKSEIKNPEKSVIMDIGGGSVEFIFTLDQNPSFISLDIGVQRLMSMFNPSDPIKIDEIAKINDYLKIQMKSIIDLIAKNNITTLVGCAGTFDTIRDLVCTKSNNPIASISKKTFKEIYHSLIYSRKIERDKIEAITELRSDMIVLALCLVQIVLNSQPINTLKNNTVFSKRGRLSVFYE